MPTNPDLTALSEAATQGTWSVCTDATGDTFVASMTDSVETICEFGAGCDDDGQESLKADAAFIVALVEAYRAGDLMLIDREGMRERAIDGIRDMDDPGSELAALYADAAIAVILGEKP